MENQFWQFIQRIYLYQQVSHSLDRIQRHPIDLSSDYDNFILLILLTFSIYRMRILTIDKYMNIVYSLIRNQYVIIKS